MYDFIKNILSENYAFSPIALLEKVLSNCSIRCRNSIKNGPNYNFQVQCCTSNCKINTYKKLISKLKSLNRQMPGDEMINKKLRYYLEQLQREQMKYRKYRFRLKRRQTTVPVNLSLKPSPERWNPKALN